jgi:hypothetical protein
MIVLMPVRSPKSILEVNLRVEESTLADIIIVYVLQLIMNFFAGVTAVKENSVIVFTFL